MHCTKHLSICPLPWRTSAWPPPPHPTPAAGARVHLSKTLQEFPSGSRSRPRRRGGPRQPARKASGRPVRMCSVPAAGAARPATPAPGFPRGPPRESQAGGTRCTGAAESWSLCSPTRPGAYPGGEARPFRACGLPLRGSVDRREPESGPGAGRRLSGAPWLRRGRRSAGRAGRGGALSSGLRCWSRPASRPRAAAAAAAGRGRAGHGKPSARSRAARVAKPPLPARLASVLLSRPLSLTLSLPGWKFPLTSREQTDGRTHARAHSGGGRWGRRRGWGKPARPDRAPRTPSPAATATPPGGARSPRAGLDSWRPRETSLVPTRWTQKSISSACSLLWGVLDTLRSLHRANRNFEIVVEVSPENHELI